ncbi:MAG: hypothetical protein V4819_19270 [Verrucomicrobiota bacterium]
MAGEWIPEKARGLISKVFPGAWEESQPGIYQGRCPGENLHHGASAETDCRIHLGYSADGKTGPGAFCLHKSCQGVLQALNEEFRNGIFAKEPNWKPSGNAPVAEEGVVKRAPMNREAWIPEFQIGKLRGLVAGVPACSPEYFIERSPVDPRKLTPGEFFEHAFRVGERIVVFTEFMGPGDYLWEVGKGGFRLARERDVKAVRSNLPVDGGKEGVWYLCNPVDGLWHPNPRRAGKYSRRSEESVTRWAHMVVESDEVKKLKLKAAALKGAVSSLKAGNLEDAEAELTTCKDPKWTEAMMKDASEERWLSLAEGYLADSRELPGLWNRLLAMAPLAIKAIYSSGGDSWHALVNVDMASKVDFDHYLRSAAKRILPKIGADPGAMTPVRLSRAPGCTRDGKLQRCIYLNPNPSSQGIPIRDLPKIRNL